MSVLTKLDTLRTSSSRLLSFSPSSTSTSHSITMLSRTSRFLPSVRSSLRLGRTTPAIHFQSQPRDIRPPFQQTPRSFHSTPPARKGIQPDSSDPQPPKAHANNVAGAAVHITEPSPLTSEQYYEYSEHYLNVLLGELEKVQEEGSDMEAEYSVCLHFMRWHGG